jgi:hypothetical protein
MVPVMLWYSYPHRMGTSYIRQWETERIVGEMPGPARATREADLMRQHQHPRVEHWLLRMVPGIGWISTYSRASFPSDLLAGVTVAAVILPITMAYG